MEVFSSEKMQIAGIQKTTLVDYPGKVAATIFLRGCNFRCGFCHNPELVLPEQFLPLIDTDGLYRFLESRLGKLQAVCITGGEPLLWGTTRKLISHIKALGFAVKLDTNGSFADRLVEIIADGDLDYIAMDIKSSLKKYKMTISNGQSSASNKNLIFNIQKSIELIKDSGIDYEFRTTVAKPLHAPEDFHDIGKMIKGAKKYYIQNFVSSKHINDHSKYEPFSTAELEESKDIIENYVSEVGLR